MTKIIIIFTSFFLHNHKFPKLIFRVTSIEYDIHYVLSFYLKVWKERRRKSPQSFGNELLRTFLLENLLFSASPEGQKIKRFVQSLDLFVRIFTGIKR